VATNVSKIIGPDSFSPKQLPLRHLEKPQGDAVHLWHLDFDQLSNPLNSEPGVQFNDLSVFQQRATRRFFLRLLLGAYLGLPGKDLRIGRRIKGRPELDSGKPMALARRYFSKAEIAALSLLGEDELHRAFMHTWACNEAIVKASGLGIANQLNRFTVDVNPDNPPSVLDMPDDDHAAWKLAIAEPAHGAIAAVAVRQQAVRLEGFNLL